MNLICNKANTQIRHLFSCYRIVIDAGVTLIERIKDQSLLSPGLEKKKLQLGSVEILIGRVKNGASCRNSPKKEKKKITNLLFVCTLSLCSLVQIATSSTPPLKRYRKVVYIPSAY